MKYIKKTLGICLLIIWLAPAAVLLFDAFAWLLTGHAPVGDAVQINVFSRVGITVLYSIAMTFITAGIGKLFYDTN